LLYDRDDRGEMAAGSELGHDTTVEAVQGDLRRNDVRADPLTVGDDGGGGLIARCLDGQHVQGRGYLRPVT